MIEVILTCLLYSGSWTPPSEWAVTKVEMVRSDDLNVPAQGHLCLHNGVWAGCPTQKGFVTLKRTFKPGEKIKVPDSCTMETKQ